MDTPRKTRLCWSRAPHPHARAGVRCQRPGGHDGLHRAPGRVVDGIRLCAAEWPTPPRHALTDEDRRLAQSRRPKAERSESSKKGWQTRRANGGIAWTHDEQRRGAAAAGAVARDKGRAYFVELGRKSGAARRAKRAA